MSVCRFEFFWDWFQGNSIALLIIFFGGIVHILEIFSCQKIWDKVWICFYKFNFKNRKYSKSLATEKNFVLMQGFSHLFLKHPQKFCNQFFKEFFFERSLWKFWIHKTILKISFFFNSRIVLLGIVPVWWRTLHNTFETI